MPPAPPESGTEPYRSIRSGSSASISSTGWFERLASGFETPSSPSRVARAPQLPTITSVVPNGRRSSSYPPIATSVGPPSPAAMTRSGMTCASAPMMASYTR